MDNEITEMKISDAIATFGEKTGSHISVALSKPESPKAVLLIIHGMNEHKERYYDFMKFLAEHSIASIICDNRGHGKSINSPEYLGYVGDGGLMVLNSLFLLKFSQNFFKRIPHFILGHSMGSLIARCVIQTCGQKVDGLFLVGTPCYTRLSPLADIVEKELEKNLGEKYRSELINEWSENLLNLKFGGVPHSWICSDVSVVNEFNNDPLCNFVYTLNGYKALIQLMRRANNAEMYNAEEKNPSMMIHLMSGKDDPCMLSEEKFFETVKFMEDVGYRNVTHKLYTGMRHEVLNETDKLQVWNDIIDKIKTVIN